MICVYQNAQLSCKIVSRSLKMFVLLLALDFIQNPQDYVMTCLATKSIYIIQRASLAALAAAVPTGDRVDIESWKFDEFTQRGLEHVWRFYREHMQIVMYLHPCQTKTSSGRRALIPIWRAQLRDLVSSFHRHANMTEEPHSWFKLDCKNRKGLQELQSAWTWISDEDMVVFDSCINLDISMCPDHITDRGMQCLKTVSDLWINWGSSIEGYGLITLVNHHKLKNLTVFGERSLAIYDVPKLISMTRRCQHFQFRDALVPKIT